MNRILCAVVAVVMPVLVAGAVVVVDRDREGSAVSASGTAVEGTAGPSGDQLTLAALRSVSVPSLCEHPAGQLVDGVLPGLDPATGEVTLVDASLGDLDGDADPEGIVTLSCTYGGNANYLGVYVYAPDLSLVGRADVEGQHDIQRDRGISLGEVSVSDGVLTVQGLDGDEDDATCCPSVFLGRRFVLLDGELVESAPEAPGRDTVLTPDGFGSLLVGQTYGAAALATGWGVDVDDVNSDVDELDTACASVGFTDASVELYGYGGEGVLHSLAVRAPGVLTEAGVGVGSTEEQVIAAYPGVPTERAHNEYVTTDDLLVLGDEGRVLRYQFADDTRRVVEIDAGDRAWATLVEGCL